MAFIPAASANGEEERVAFYRMEKMIEGILTEVNPDTYQIYVSGGTNFRYEINPFYKANRDPSAVPIHRKACHQFLIDHYGAIETDGYEADDVLGVEQTDDTILCSLDKDLLMIPGRHYSWPITRKNVIVRDHIYREVSYEDGITFFFRQMLIGDKADNIIGVAGLGPVKAAKTIPDGLSEQEMFDIVRTLYNDDQRFYMNLDLLWIWRQLGITYTIRTGIDVSSLVLPAGNEVEQA